MSRVDQQQPVGRQGTGTPGGVDLKQGAIYGAGAWIVGIVLTGVLAWVEFRDAAQSLDQLGGSGEFSQLAGSGGSLPSAVDFVGWLFYNAHFVDVGLSIMGQGFWLNFVTASVNLTGQIAQMADNSGVSQMERGLETLFGTVPTPVWLLVPVVALIVAGYAVANRSGAYDATQGAKAGASIAAGYLVLSVGGTFLFAWSLPSGSLGMSLSVAPQLMMAAGLMGLVYPAVFGGIGGALAAATTDQPTRSQPTRQSPQGRQGYQQGGQQRAGGQGRPPAGQQGRQQARGQQGSYQQQTGGRQGQQQTGGQQRQQPAGGQQNRPQSGGQQNQQSTTGRRGTRSDQPAQGQQPAAGQRDDRERSPRDQPEDDARGDDGERSRRDEGDDRQQ